MTQVKTQREKREKTFKVTVGYLPATTPFEKRYDSDTQMSIVRTESMAHFGVQNHTDRDTHEFFLELDGDRITDYSVTLEGLLGKKPKKAEFDLVEQVTAGGP